MDIEKVVANTIKEYKLIRRADKVVVALSGGKDSTGSLLEKGSQESKLS